MSRKSHIVLFALGMLGGQVLLQWLGSLSPEETTWWMQTVIYRGLPSMAMAGLLMVVTGVFRGVRPQTLVMGGLLLILTGGLLLILIGAALLLDTSSLAQRGHLRHGPATMPSVILPATPAEGEQL
jgi:hypothetical protein